MRSGPDAANPDPHPDASAERRAHARTQTLIKVQPRQGGPAMMAQDISVGGMMVTSSVPRWPGTMVAVRFTLPGQRRAIQATCRVVEPVEVPHGVGLSLRFLELAPEAKLAIAAYVDSLTDAAEERSTIAQIETWVGRIVADCRRLRALG